MSYTDKKGPFTLVLMCVAKNKTPGTQLYIMVNMSVKFYDCGCYIFGISKAERMEGTTDKGKPICPILFQGEGIKLNVQTCFILYFYKNYCL